MHEMLFLAMFTVSLSLSVMWLKSAAVRAVYTACRVHGVIQCSLCQITLTTCSCMISNIPSGTYIYASR